jgi:hypothetical protein
MSKQKAQPIQETLPSGVLARTAHWLSKRARRTRILLAALTALITTTVIALILFNLFFRTRPDQINIGLANALLIGVAFLGLALYWLGWRLLVGFDFAETPLQIGKAAALYVLVGTLIGSAVLIWALFAIAEALSAP